MKRDYAISAIHRISHTYDSLCKLVKIHRSAYVAPKILYLAFKFFEPIKVNAELIYISLKNIDSRGVGRFLICSIWTVHAITSRT